MEKKKAAVSKPVIDEREKLIDKLLNQVNELTDKLIDRNSRLELYRQFVREHGPVSSVEKLNQILIKLKSVGEI